MTESLKTRRLMDLDQVNFFELCAAGGMAGAFVLERTTPLGS